MQKKQLVVAVSSALGAICAAPVLAQNATVNVYGTMYGEYSWTKNGARSATEPYQPRDHWQNPGSELGFRGEEKLGGGLSVWFQCATSLDYRGTTNSSSSNSQAVGSWCTRNSAFGLKGVFGNVYYGNWQTPWTRINSAANVGSNDTGVFGNAHIIAGTSSTFGIQSPSQGTIVNLSPAVYRRRQNNLLTYETPNLAGFSVMGAMTARGYASAATGAQFRARLWSLGAQYANGPLFVGAAYELHDNFYSRNTVAAPVVPVQGDDRGWTIGATYTFSNNLKIGGHYNDFKSEASFFNPATGIGGDTKVKAWHIGLDWMISGPHGVRAAYSRAGNVSGAYVISATGVLTGTAMNARPAAGPSTAADMWQIRYVYQLSKRTEVTAGMSWTNNRANATYETGGSSTTQLGGSDSHAYAMALRHSF
jgi:predicted porin